MSEDLFNLIWRVRDMLVALRKRGTFCVFPARLVTPMQCTRLEAECVLLLLVEWRVVVKHENGMYEIKPEVNNSKDGARA